MPLLATLLVTLFSGLASFLAQYVTRKVAFGLAAVAVFTTLTTGLFAFMRSTISALSASAGLSGAAAQLLGAAFPPVSPACVSAYITVWTACALYKWQVKALDVFTKS